jgi:Mg2+/Co2+ transporter CorC
VAGVLTVKDLLEPIVGELHDELDIDEEPPVVRVDGARWLVDGRTNVDEVRDRLGIEIPEGDYVTLGGYLLDGLGHIPLEGETLRVDGWDLVVQEMDKRRIAKVLARRRGSSAPAVAATGGELTADGSGGAAVGGLDDSGGPGDVPGAPPVAGTGPADLPDDAGGRI